MYIGLRDKNHCKGALQILVRYLYFLRIRNLTREWYKGYYSRNGVLLGRDIVHYVYTMYLTLLVICFNK